MSFLTDTYQKSKLLFGVFILFVVGQIFFTYKGVETVPFFHYGMYSEPMPAKTNGYWLISGNDTLNDELTHLSRAFLFQNINHHKQLKKNEINSVPIYSAQEIFKSEQTKQIGNQTLENWMAHYLQNITGKNVPNLKAVPQ